MSIRFTLTMVALTCLATNAIAQDSDDEGTEAEIPPKPSAEVDDGSRRFGCIVGDIESCITIEEYRNAGLVGTFVGFGSGYFMTGENGRGAGFLISETLFASAVVTGVLLFVDVIPMSDAMTADFLGGIMYLGGSALLVAVRTWEKVDVWKRPRHTRVIYESARKTSLTPLVTPTRGRDGVGGVAFGLGGTF